MVLSQPEDDEVPDVPRQVQSVVRAISLIAAVADYGGGLTLTELARTVGLSLSTTYRLVQTLCANDVLCRGPNGDHFVPGPLLMHLARSSLAWGGVHEAADILHAVTERTRETASLGIRQGNFAVIVLVADSPEALRCDRKPGMQLQLHASAIGRALLAFGAQDVTDAVSELEPLARCTPRTTVDGRHVVNELRATAYRRWAISDEEHDLGIRSIAAPILGSDGVAHAAIAIDAPATRLPDDAFEHHAGIVLDAARSLSRLPVATGSMMNAAPATWAGGALSRM